MKGNILFYGSCQNDNLYSNDLCGRSFLRESLKDFNVTTIRCYDTDISEEDFNKIYLPFFIHITQHSPNEHCTCKNL